MTTGDFYSSFFPNNDIREELDSESPEPRDWAIPVSELEVGHKILSSATGDIHR